VWDNRGRGVRAAGWALPALTVLELVATLVLAGLNASRIGTSKTGAAAAVAVAVLLYAGTGLLITTRVPGNPIGWLLGLVGLSAATSIFAEQYAVYGLATVRGSLPATRLVGDLAGAAAQLTVVLLIVLILLFPDGRLPSRRWRPVAWAIGVVAAGWVTQDLQVGTIIGGGLTNALYGAKATYRNPYGVLPPHGWYSDLLKVIFIFGIVTALLVITSVFVRRRGATTELRKQLAWLGYVGVMTAIWALVLALSGVIAPDAANAWLGALIWAFLVLTPVAGIPAACAVAILKYRLYEIDRVISRTLAYAIVTGLLVGVYAGLVLLATEVFKFRTPVAVAAATLAAAALFTPLRSRVQRVVDRRFNRTRYDADRTVMAFAARLKDAVDQDAIQADLLAVVQQSLEPAHATLWVRPAR
jgi:hypothetical protein